MSALNDQLRDGPVWIIANNTPKYVVLFAEDFQRMRHEMFVQECHESAAELRAELEPLLGTYSPAEAVVMCGSGVTACHLLLAFEIAGLHGARLYAGSWSEWCSDQDRPVAR